MRSRQNKVLACRPVAPHHIPTLAEEFYAQWHHVVVAGVALPVIQIVDVDEAVLLHRINDRLQILPAARHIFEDNPIFDYCCPVKLLETIEIRAEYLAWYSALVVTFVFSQ